MSLQNFLSTLPINGVSHSKQSLSDFSLDKRNSLFNFIKEKKLDSLKENIAEYAKHYFITDNDMLEKEEIENLELNFGA